MLEVFLRLSLCPGIGPVAGKKILSQFKNPKDIFQADPDYLCSELGIPHRTATNLKKQCYARAADIEIKEARTRGIKLITLCDKEYPGLLKHTYAPPLVLRVWGNLRKEDQLAIAVIGTRKTSSYGRRQAIRFVRELSSLGLVIVSGLARGIDGIAHREALRAKERTIAVLGSGLARIYPSEHRELAGLISRSGAVISELPLFTPPLSHHFPRRNRIISGLSMGVLVIEGGQKSGTMITARFAAEQGRTVFAIPGQIDSPNSCGTNELLRDGAVLVTKVEDIINELDYLKPILRKKTGKINLPELTRIENNLLNNIAPGPVEINTVTQKTSMTVNEVMAAITSLELKGYLQRFGNTIERI